MKKIGKITLTLLLIASILCGCAGNAGVSSDPEGSAESASEESSAMQNAETETETAEAILYTVRITEIMPSNKSTVTDGAGNFPDWIEICNYGTESLDLSGVTVFEGEDGAEIQTDGEVPVIAPGEYRVIWCSKKGTAAAGQWQAELAISNEDSTVMLMSPSGQTLDSAEYTEQESDAAFYLDADGNWQSSYFATPGFSNDEEGYEQLQSAKADPGTLEISEVLVYNDSFCSLNGTCYDLVELRNNSSDPVMLSDYYLTDKAGKWDRYRLPETELGPGEVYLIYCTGEDSMAESNADCAPFALNASDEKLYLFDAEGTLADYVHLHDISRGSSMGRISGQNGWFYFDEPTPGEENGQGYRVKEDTLSASVESGVYEDVDILEVALEGEGTIYYTLDGSVPDEQSNVYETPFELSETTVIRAMDVSEKYGNSEVKTFSYIINEGHTMPVTSLVCDPDEMFGSSGVYTLVDDRDLTCEGEVSYFSKDGTGFTNGCTIGLHGANSRVTLFKKSLKLTFGSAYGEVSYPLFEGSDITTFHSLTLRGGGSDRLETLRDETFCEVAEHCSDEEMFCLDTTYTILYINGKYYGIYAWREAYSEQYVADHTGADEDEVEIVRSFISGTDFEPVARFIMNNSMADEDNYAYAESLLDMRSVATWTAIEAFFENRDISGNVRYVRESPDSKWKMMLFDLDFTLVGQGADWSNVINYDYTMGVVLNSLLSSPEFCDVLLECTAELYHNGMDEEYVHSVLEKYITLLDTEVERDCSRWSVSVDSWYIYSDQLYDYSDRDHTVQWIRTVQSLTNASDEKITELFGDLE